MFREESMCLPYLQHLLLWFPLQLLFVQAHLTVNELILTNLLLNTPGHVMFNNIVDLFMCCLQKMFNIFNIIDLSKTQFVVIYSNWNERHKFLFFPNYLITNPWRNH